MSSSDYPRISSIQLTLDNNETICLETNAKQLNNVTVPPITSEVWRWINAILNADQTGAQTSALTMSSLKLERLLMHLLQLGQTFNWSVPPVSMLIPMLDNLNTQHAMTLVYMMNAMEERPMEDLMELDVVSTYAQNPYYAFTSQWEGWWKVELAVAKWRDRYSLIGDYTLNLHQTSNHRSVLNIWLQDLGLNPDQWPEGLSVAGGAIASLLFRRDPEDMDLAEDIDFWVTGSTLEERKERFKTALQYLSDGKPDIVYSIKKSCVTLVMKGSKKNLQLIYTNHPSPLHVVSNFDLPHVKAFYAGGDIIWMTRELELLVDHRIGHINPENLKVSRLFKWMRYPISTKVEPVPKDHWLRKAVDIDFDQQVNLQRSKEMRKLMYEQYDLEEATEQYNKYVHPPIDISTDRLLFEVNRILTPDHATTSIDTVCEKVRYDLENLEGYTSNVISASKFNPFVQFRLNTIKLESDICHHPVSPYKTIPTLPIQHAPSIQFEHVRLTCFRPIEGCEKVTLSLLLEPSSPEHEILDQINARLEEEFQSVDLETLSGLMDVKLDRSSARFVGCIRTDEYGQRWLTFNLPSDRVPINATSVIASFRLCLPYLINVCYRVYVKRSVCAFEIISTDEEKSTELVTDSDEDIFPIVCVA